MTRNLIRQYLHPVQDESLTFATIYKLGYSTYLIEALNETVQRPNHDFYDVGSASFLSFLCYQGENGISRCGKALKDRRKSTSCFLELGQRGEGRSRMRLLCLVGERRGTVN
ncbi:hypothetical protein JTB14_009385 [Gonioctena quinquepunctata]|nr:hypothetical protein JTB14_009385 [Gonioctena quinquepunctata]